ncbi:hypothetical protein L6R52_28355, partial [Myxococcota bacterium]|nr:hypothetical protein [Myxococcota bacterium]
MPAALVLVVAVSSTACLRALPAQVVERHVAPSALVDGPKVVASSAPVEPAWVRATSTSSAGIVL